MIIDQDNLTWTAASATATYELLEGEEVMISYLPVSHIVAQVIISTTDNQSSYCSLGLGLRYLDDPKHWRHDPLCRQRRVEGLPFENPH